MSDETRRDPIEDLLTAHSQLPDDSLARSRIWWRVQTSVRPSGGRRQEWVLALLAAAIPLVGIAAVALVLAGSPRTAQITPIPGGSRTPTPTITTFTKPSPPQYLPSLSRLEMMDRSNGWGLTEFPPAPASRARRMVRTTDGGHNWTAVLDSVVATDVHDAQTAWAVSEEPGSHTAGNWQAAVQKTTDGGRTWTVVGHAGAGGEVSAVQFLDAAHGWIFATPSSGAPTGAADTTLLRTGDGGASWQVVVDAGHGRPGVPASLPAPCRVGGPIGPPVFADAANGWVGAFCDHVFFYVTHDGGLTWAPQALPAFPGPAWAGGGTFPLVYNTWSIEFTNPRSGRFLLARGQTTGANALQEEALYTTGNGGATWQATRMPASAIELSFADASHAWMIAAGDRGNNVAVSLYSSSDGARSWTRLLGPADGDAAGPLGFLESGAELKFVDATTGFIWPRDAASPTLYRTDDGGHTWKPVPMRLP